MGMAASTGRNNDELIDNLVEADLIITEQIEKVCRLVDRAAFFPPDGQNMAYKDMAWKSDIGEPGHIHISAPSIYANVLENLELSKGQSFLNIGSGTGYLNSIAGFILGSGGVNHGIELHANIVGHARQKISEVIFRPETQCFEWAMPVFTCGNGLLLSPAHYGKYDRVYCGAAVATSHKRIPWELIKIGGIIIMPYDGQLIQVRRVGLDRFEEKVISTVSFSDFVLPTEEEQADDVQYSAPSFSLPSLQHICRVVIRKCIREVVSLSHSIRMRSMSANRAPSTPSTPVDTDQVIVLPHGGIGNIGNYMEQQIFEILRAPFDFIRTDGDGDGDEGENELVAHRLRRHTRIASHGRNASNQDDVNQGLGRRGMAFLERINREDDNIIEVEGPMNEGNGEEPESSKRRVQRFGESELNGEKSVAPETESAKGITEVANDLQMSSISSSSNRQCKRFRACSGGEIDNVTVKRRTGNGGESEEVGNYKAQDGKCDNDKNLFNVSNSGRSIDENMAESVSKINKINLCENAVNQDIIGIIPEHSKTKIFSSDENLVTETKKHIHALEVSGTQKEKSYNNTRSCSSLENFEGSEQKGATIESSLKSGIESCSESPNTTVQSEDRTLVQRSMHNQDCESNNGESSVVDEMENDNSTFDNATGPDTSDEDSEEEISDMLDEDSPCPIDEHREQERQEQIEDMKNFARAFEDLVQQLPISRALIEYIKYSN